MGVVFIAGNYRLDVRGQSGADVGVEDLNVTVEDLVQAMRGNARGARTGKGLDGVGGKLVATSGGKRTRTELEDISNVKTSDSVGILSKGSSFGGDAPTLLVN